MRRLKMGSTIIAKICVQMVYYVSMVLFPVNEKKVTFASYRIEQLKGNLYFIYNELQRQSDSYSCTFLFKKYHTSILGKADYLLHMLRASYHLATSRYFFIDDYYFPAYVIKPRQRTEIVQLWHAAGAFKKFGYSTVDKEFGPSDHYLKHVKIHSNYSKAMVSSSEVIPYFAEAFNMPSEDILPLGVPRTDYFLWDDEHRRVKKQFYQQYPELSGKKLILYAPTFRGKSHGQETFRTPLDVARLANSLGQDYALLIHVHPYMENSVKVEKPTEGFAYHMSGQFNIQELMVLSDMLITDYSSVVFDFSLLTRPIAFFADDLGEYMKERDFYYDFQSFIPGPFFTNSVSLASWIKNGVFDRKAVVDFRDRFFDYIDGNSSQRIIDYFFNQTPVIGDYSHSIKGWKNTGL